MEWNIWTKLRGRVNSMGHHGELVRQVRVAISASVLFTKGRQEGNTWNKLTLLKFIPLLETITITNREAGDHRSSAKTWRKHWF